MGYLVISTSLHPQSRSRTMAKIVAEAVREFAPDSEYVDLRDLNLPNCDGTECYENPAVQAIGQKIRDGAGIILATPIYNYAVAGSAKNLLELTGSAWTDKVVGFVCAAGGASSYMAVMGLANSLMLDFRSVILPRFVYADDGSFEGERITNPVVEQRLAQLAETLHRFATALQLPPDDSEAGGGSFD